MTGRHAAPRDEAFDQLERDRAGAHRADVEALPATEAEALAAQPQAAPVKKPAARAKAAPVKKAPIRKTAPSSSKKAGTS